MNLSNEQIELFKSKGWVGPLDAFSKEELESIKSYIKTISKEEVSEGQPYLSFNNAFLGINTPREHHLACPELLALFASEKVTNYLKQLGEPDLLLWKTNIFHKMPGQAGIGWHQAHDYFGHEVEDDVPHEKKTLHFPKEKDVYSFVIWLAIEDATIENGCVIFANGTQKHHFPSMKVPLEESALSSLTSQKMDWQEKRNYSKVFVFNEGDWETEPAPVKAGQILIFTEGVMHCSPANRSDSIRFGINARYVPPSVKVYPHREHGDFVDGTGHNIEKHCCILVFGKDEYGINKTKSVSDI